MKTVITSSSFKDTILNTKDDVVAESKDILLPPQKITSKKDEMEPIVKDESEHSGLKLSEMLTAISLIISGIVIISLLIKHYG